MESERDAGTSLGELLFSMDDVHDEEGRPLGERRASSRAKEGCPMELVPCPYPDERHGISMHQSALEQIRGYLKPVLRDIASFHGTLPPEVGGWRRMVLAILDQLSGPAVHVLRGGARPVPARLAVGYKLAAGFFDVSKHLLRRELIGEARPPTASRFLELVKDERALIGASEVCAGPPKLIRRATEVLLAGDVEEGGAADPRRREVAERLAHQLVLATTWKIFDAAAEAELLRCCAGEVEPANPFIADKLAARMRELDAADPPSGRVCSESPIAWVPPPHRDPLLEAIEGYHRAPPAAGLDALAELTPHRVSALRPSGAEVSRAVEERFLRYLAVRRALVRAQLRLEWELRDVLDRPERASVALGKLVLPVCRTSPWFRACLGVDFSCEPSAAAPIELRARGACVALPG